MSMTAQQAMQGQINTLLNKSVVQPKISGAPTSDIETASVIESLAIAMLLNPRAALYSHYLAKNGLVAAIDTEVAAIEDLKKDILDLGNVTYAVQDTTELLRASSAMLQLSVQGQLSADSNAFSRYSSAIDSFLNNQLSKNIKQPNSAELVRPGDEARQSLPTDLATTKTAHADFLNRLYALTVGVTNFVNTPFSAMVGGNAVYRTKKDLDALISEFATDNSGAQSRDAALRLISGRSTVRMLGTKLNMVDPVVDTVSRFPKDQLLSGKSVETPVTALTTAGPFVMAPGGSLSITVSGQTVTTSVLNQAANAAAVLGTTIAYPVSVPANYHLFVHLEASGAAGPWTAGAAGSTLEGTYSEATLGTGWYLNNGIYTKTVKATLNSGDPSTTPPGSTSPLSMSLLDVLTSINSAMGAYGMAAEFLGTGVSNRTLVVASEPKIMAISITNTFTEMEPQSLGYVSSPGATIYWPRVYTNSFHAQLGFGIGQSGTAGSTPTDFIVDGLNSLFSSILTAVRQSDGTVLLTSFATSPGTTMSMTGTWLPSLGLASSYVASTTTTMLEGTSGVVSPIGIVDIGDSLQSPTGKSSIAALGDSSFDLSTPIPTFSGDITVTSALVLVWTEVDSQVREFLRSWLLGPYATDLEVLDRVIAVLIGSAASPRRNEAIALLNDLESQLLGLRIVLTSTSASLPSAAAKTEKSVINNLISIFTERKFDRALDLLFRCQLQEIFQLDWQTSSYGGNLMRAAEAIAQNDIVFPDTSKDEGFDVQGLRLSTVSTAGR